MLSTRQDIERELNELSDLVRRIPKCSGAAILWIEFLNSANAIKDRVPSQYRYWVTARIYELMASHALSPPWQKTSERDAKTGRVYAFPTGLRLS
jgi:hypothetical protein